MAYEHLHVQTTDAITTITINNQKNGYRPRPRPARSQPIRAAATLFDPPHPELAVV